MAFDQAALSPLGASKRSSTIKRVASKKLYRRIPNAQLHRMHCRCSVNPHVLQRDHTPIRVELRTRAGRTPATHNPTTVRMRNSAKCQFIPTELRGYDIIYTHTDAYLYIARFFSVLLNQFAGVLLTHADASVYFTSRAAAALSRRLRHHSSVGNRYSRHELARF